jgi:uncharacterized protein YegL
MGRSAFIIFAAFLAVCMASSCGSKGDEKKKAETPAVAAKPADAGDSAGPDDCTENLKKIVNAALKYYSGRKLPPPDLESLVEGAFLSKGVPLEHNGKRFLYLPSGLAVNTEKVKDPIVVCLRDAHRRKGRLVALRSGAVRWMRERSASRTIAEQKMEYRKLLKRQRVSGRPALPKIIDGSTSDKKTESGVSSDARALYDKALDLLKKGDFANAERTFEEFLKKAALDKKGLMVEKYRQAQALAWAVAEKSLSDKLKEKQESVAGLEYDLAEERKKIAELSKKAKELDEKKFKEAVEKVQGKILEDCKLKALEKLLEKEEWIYRAICYSALKAWKHPRATWLLARALQKEKQQLPLYFVLGSLKERPDAELVANGGRELVESLFMLSKRVKNSYWHSRVIEIFMKMSGERLGTKWSSWTKWWKKNIDDFAAAEEPEYSTLTEEDKKLLREHIKKHGMRTGLEKTITTIASFREAGKALEVVFCIDQTGSMTGVINKVKDEMAIIVQAISHVVPKYRLGVITYDDAIRFSQPLTDSRNRLVSAVKAIIASGGGDYEEGVDKALEKALKLGAMVWSRKKNVERVVVIIGDAPPHPADLERTLTMARNARLSKTPFMICTVSTRSSFVPNFEEIAKEGGGKAILLDKGKDLIAQLIALSLGVDLEEHLGAFVEQLVEIITALEKK